ncbi:MAG: hypothetical protein ACRDHO_06395, partial [Actinomycetota bacterium]
ELHRAVQATLASKSSVVPTRIGDEPDFEFVEVYQAPDRLRETIGDHEKITIGRDRWAGPGAIDGTYVRTTAEHADRRDTFEQMLTDLRPLATATDVSRDGAAYRFRFGTDGKVLSGTATITGGRIGTLAIGPGPGHGWATETVISDYDQAPAVDPPPAEKILDQDDLRRGTIDPAIADLLAD